MFCTELVTVDAVDVTVSCEVLPQMEIPEEMDTGAAMFCHNNWCAITIAY